MSKTSCADSTIVEEFKETEEGCLAVVELRIGEEVLREIRQASEEVGWPLTELAPCLIVEGLEAVDGL